MFPDLKTRPFEFMTSSGLSSPTCEELGIPRDDIPQKTEAQTTKCFRNVSLSPDGLGEPNACKRDPFSPMCMIPVPGQFGFGIFETTFIRKRNERERDRVRCVNEGYNKLKQHLPLRNKQKRISKVETLRSAIQYIKHLQTLLNQNGGDKNFVETLGSARVDDICIDMKSEGTEDSETDLSDLDQKYDPQDSVCSSDDDAFS